MDKKAIGDAGERVASEFLEHKGYEILHKNYRTTYGEIDIICIHKQTKALVFVEVKTRKNLKFGRASENVNFTKQKKITKSAFKYLSEYPHDFDIRFDVIEIYYEEKRINHLKNAFEAVEYELF